MPLPTSPSMDDADGRAGRLTIVTHRRPHLDEVVASWLLRTFDPAFKDCEFYFIANTPTGGNIPAGANMVPLGVGRGKYDEHGMNAGQSATKLVYEDLLSRGLIPNDRYEDKAIAWLVDFAHKEDTGQWELQDEHATSFAIPAILRGVWTVHKNSWSKNKVKGQDPDNAMMRFGLEMIHGLVEQLNERAKFLADWDKRIEFDTKWGKGVGLESTYRGSDVEAYHRGFVLRVQTDPTRPFGDFRAQATSNADLAEVYEKLNAEEPGAWFLHQSHKIVTASMDKEVGAVTNKTLHQLIDLVRK